VTKPRKLCDWTLEWNIEMGGYDCEICGWMPDDIAVYWYDEDNQFMAIYGRTCFGLPEKFEGTLEEMIHFILQFDSVWDEELEEFASKIEDEVKQYNAIEPLFHI
jgi:hypothetical protein